MLRIRHIDFLEGANCYGQMPVMRIHLRSDVDLAEAQSQEIIAIAEGQIPELSDALKIDRQEISATRLIVLISLALQNRLSIPVSYGTCRHEAHHASDAAHAVVEFEIESLARRAAQLAVRLANFLLSNKHKDQDDCLVALQTFGDGLGPTPTVRALADAATDRGIPYAFIDRRTDCLRLGEGHRCQLMVGTLSSGTGAVDEVVARDQLLALNTLATRGLPTVNVQTPADSAAAQSLVERSDQTCWLAARQVMTEPTLIPVTMESVVAEFERLQNRHGGVLLFRHTAGIRYRVLVVEGRAAAAWEAGEQKCANLLEHLEGGLTVLAENAAKTLSLQVCGIDVMLTGSGADTAVHIAAVNPRAALPWPGDAARDAAKQIIDAMFPVGEPATIPIVVVSGGPERIELTNTIADTASAAGQRVATISDDSIEYAGHEVSGYDTRASAVRALLTDRELEMLLVTCTPESIETNGLSVPHCSIGVIADAAAPRTAPPGLANGLEVLMRSADYLIVDGTVEIDNSHHTCLVTTEIVGSDVKQPSLENGSQVICVDNVDDSRPAMAIATVQKLKLIGPASV